MITIEQCRGARGILGWTQQELADASGLSKTAINNFEKQHSDIKAESLKAIRMAFESADIEFLDKYGVRKKTQDIQILSGDHALDSLLHDIYMSCDKHSNELIICELQQNFFDKLTSIQVKKHASMIQKLGVEQRILSTSKPTKPNIDLENTEQRILSEKEYSMFGQSTYIYNNKVAIVLWDQSMIILTKSAKAHNAEKSRFERIWALAEPVYVEEEICKLAAE